MKVGYATSIIGHALLLGWGLIALPSAKPLEAEAIDALPVDIVSLSDVTRLSEGVKTAPKRDTASQQPIKPPAPRPESTRAGAASTDQKTPVTEKATDTAAAKEAKPAAPPPPPPAPERPPEPPKAAEKPAPPPAPAPAPDPAPPTEVAALDPAPPQADIGEIVAKAEKADAPSPAPVPPTVLPRAKPKPPAPVETASIDERPTPPKKTEPVRPSEPTPVAEKKPVEEEFDPNQLAALLNKVDPSGGGARASDAPASLGSETATGQVAEMTQSELDYLRARLIACWNPPIGAEGADSMRVPVRFQLNPDGTLAGEPVAGSIPAGPVGMIMAESALRAVRKCEPFDFLPPEKYESWRTVNINFDPQGMY